MKRIILLIIDKIRKALKVDENGNSFGWGKGTLLLAALMIVGCVEKNDNGEPIISDYYRQHSVENPYLQVLDSCEYICWNSRMAHKGNCRFCKERRQKELKELITKLKEK